MTAGVIAIAHLLVAALDDPRHRLALAVADRGRDLVPRGHGPAVDGDDAVAFLQSRSLGRRDRVARLALRLRHLEGGRRRRHAGREEPDLGGDLRQAVERDDAGQEHAPR